MVLAAVLSIAATLAEFNTGLRPALLAKAETVLLSLKRDVEYAVSIGVPYSEIRGIDVAIETLVRENPEINQIELLGPDAIMHETAGSISTPAPNEEEALTRLKAIGLGAAQSLSEIFSAFTGNTGGAFAYAEITANGQAVAQLRATINEDYVNEQMTSVFFDTLVILIAVSLVALEVVVVALASQVTEPLRRVEAALENRAAGRFMRYPVPANGGRIARFLWAINAANDRLRTQVRQMLDGSGAAVDKLHDFAANHVLFAPAERRRASVMDARIPLFVFCFAEELQKSFLPLFVAEYHGPGDWFARDIMLGLPITCFMFVIAAFTPFAGKFVDRFGAKRLFLFGLVPATAGYLGCFAAQSANDIVLSRSVTAIGYAIITISAQSYIAAVLTKENRARGMAIFVGVLMTATMCGTAIGAILADWLGYKPVFLVATGFALVAGILGYAMLSGGAQEGTGVSKSVGAKQGGAFAKLIRNSQFVLIVLFCAIPAKIILTGFLYLFVPLYLANLDASQSEIGRIMMIYSLVIIPVSPLAARFADQIGKNIWVVIFATIASGVVLLGLYQSPSVAAVLTVVAALGVAHSFIKAPLIVAAMEAAEASPDVTRTGAMAILRTSERIGSVLGPVMVAAMLVVLDYAIVAAVLGVGVAVLGTFMALVSLRRPGPGEAAHA
jgi:predicted MFS family arabinose efflux permease